MFLTWLWAPRQSEGALFFLDTVCAVMKVLTAVGHQTAAETAWGSDLPLSNPAVRVWGEGGRDYINFALMCDTHASISG